MVKLSITRWIFRFAVLLSLLASSCRCCIESCKEQLKCQMQLRETPSGLFRHGEEYLEEVEPSSTQGRARFSCPGFHKQRAVAKQHQILRMYRVLIREFSTPLSLSRLVAMSTAVACVIPSCFVDTFTVVQKALVTSPPILSGPGLSAFGYPTSPAPKPGITHLCHC